MPNQFPASTIVPRILVGTLIVIGVAIAIEPILLLVGPLLLEDCAECLAEPRWAVPLCVG